MEHFFAVTFFVLFQGLAKINVLHFLSPNESSKAKGAKTIAGAIADHANALKMMKRGENGSM
jgi:hypothetical protein